MSKSQVSPALVNLMTKYYGTVEAARQAYAKVRDEVREHNASPKRMQGGKVVWVDANGQIAAVYSAVVFYAGSPDAAYVLPS